MSRDFPDWVHPDRAAAARREFSGTVPLWQMRRLADLVEAPGEAKIGFELRFGHDEQQQVRVEVAVIGEVPLRCQRSLHVYHQPVDSRSVVGIVASDRDAAALPDDYEPLLCSDNRVRLLRLVEEELMLALPLVPIDPATERITQAGAEHDTHRPFADLAELKKQRDK